MSDIEAKAVVLLNEVRKERGHPTHPEISRKFDDTGEALCRAIERHEATTQQHEKLKWEVSFAVLSAMKVLLEMAEHDCEVRIRPILERFIITKPDPLHKCLEEALARNGEDLTEHTDRLRAALEARGLEIREKGQ